MIVIYVALVFAAIGGTAFGVYRSQDFRKFLAGAFLVSAGVQFYLAWMGVRIPLAGTDSFQTPEVGWARGSIHAVLFVLSTYFGFVRRPKQAAPTRASRGNDSE